MNPEGLRRRDALRMTPHGVYRAYDAQGLLLYVGCSINPERRLKAHRSTSRWYPLMVRWEQETHPTFWIARAVERAAVDTEHPEFNVRLTLSQRRAQTANAIAACRRNLAREAAA